MRPPWGPHVPPCGPHATPCDPHVTPCGPHVTPCDPTRLLQLPPQWRKNPQYEIVAMTGTEAYLLLMQPDPRLDDRRAEDTNKIG
eukprot:5478146-Prymnesium_polylepis.1